MAIVLNTKFAAWVDEILSTHGIKTLRQAEPRTGISHSTIKNMKDGRVPEESAIIRFAVAFRESVPEALRLAGYEEMAEMWEENDPSSLEERVVSREPVYDDLPPELRQVVGLHAKVVNALPPGRQRDQYIASLKAQAEANWALLEEREKYEGKPE